MIGRTLAVILALGLIVLALPQAALAALTYTYQYDFTSLPEGGAGQLSFQTSDFITSTSFVPAIYHNDPVGDPLLRINFRNPFQSVNGSPLVSNPVLDLILSNFSIGGFVGGPINQLGTLTQFNSPGSSATLIISQTADNSIRYEYDYNFSALPDGGAGNLYFTVPTFITNSISFAPISHTDPTGKPLEFLGFRNAFHGYDGTQLQNPVIDLFLDGFSIGGLIQGPLNHTGTFVQLDGPGASATLTISGTPDSVAVPEPSSTLLLAPLLVNLIVIGWRRTRRGAWLIGEAGPGSFQGRLMPR